jgi:hypothetical protein
MNDTSTGNSKVVVNRCMSLDGFIAGPGHAMDWGGSRQLADFVGPDEFHEIAAATGAMLVGRRTADVGDRMEAEKPGSVDYPFSGLLAPGPPPDRPGTGQHHTVGHRHHPPVPRPQVIAAWPFAACASQACRSRAWLLPYAGHVHRLRKQKHHLQGRRVLGSEVVGDQFDGACDRG